VTSLKRTATNPHLRLGLLAMAGALLADQASKLWLLFIYDLGRRGIVAVAPFIDLVLAWNSGISYGWLQTETATGRWLLLGFKVIAVAALGIWMARSETRLATFSLGLIIGGAIGNAIDRTAYGAVVDFVMLHAEFGGKVHYWYVFNIADTAIVAGVIGLLYDTLRGQPAAKAP